MTIDILTYQLLYKNDNKVLDLLEAYITSEEFLQCEYELDSEKQEKIDDLDGTIDDLKSQIEDYSDSAKDLAHRLNVLECLDKEGLIEAIKDIAQDLESLASRMTF